MSSMKVWSNFKRPVELFETDLNTITTRFCTDARHKKCVARGICRAQEPQFEVAKCEKAGMSYHHYVDVEVRGSLNDRIVLSKKRDKKVAAALASDLRACKAYVLSWVTITSRVKAAVDALLKDDEAIARLADQSVKAFDRKPRKKRK